MSDHPHSIPPGETHGSETLYLTHSGHESIRMDTVVYCTASDKECTVFLNNGNMYTLNETLQSVREKLPAHRFVQLHPSHIVNIDFINRYVPARPAHIVLFDGTQITIPSSERKRYQKLLNSF
jgi:two-component system LytT family response regulator